MWSFYVKASAALEEGFLGSTVVKNLPAHAGRVRKIPWRRKWQPTPVFFLGESHGQRSLEGYNLSVHGVAKNWALLSMHTT